MNRRRFPRTISTVDSYVLTNVISNDPSSKMFSHILRICKMLSLIRVQIVCVSSNQNVWRMIFGINRMQMDVLLCVSSCDFSNDDFEKMIYDIECMENVWAILSDMPLVVVIKNDN